MNVYEPIGYLASMLVLATFCMRDMVSLRVVAIASNFAFIAYGALVGITPVLLLHVVLLPVNLLRLVESVRLALRHRAEAAQCAQRRCALSEAPWTGDTEPAVASPRLSELAPRGKAAGRARKGATLQ